MIYLRCIEEIIVCNIEFILQITPWFMNKKTSKKRRILRTQVNYYVSTEKHHHAWEMNQCVPNTSVLARMIRWWAGATGTTQHSFPWLACHCWRGPCHHCHCLWPASPSPGIYSWRICLWFISVPSPSRSPNLSWTLMNSCFISFVGCASWVFLIFFC